jgi:hypothetical protein
VIRAVRTRSKPMRRALGFPRARGTLMGAPAGIRTWDLSLRKRA